MSARRHQCIKNGRTDNRPDNLKHHIHGCIFPAHPAGQQNAQGNGRINMTARDSSDSVCHRHNGQAESKSHSQRSDTCTNRPRRTSGKDSTTTSHQDKNHCPDHFCKSKYKR